MNIEVKHVDISEQVYQIIKRMILNREFVGGQKLDLNNLATKMNVSRTPLKDAVNRLVSEGLLEVKPRSGTFVTKITIEQIKNIFEMRLMIEKWCLSKLDREKAEDLVAALIEITKQSKKVIESKEFSYSKFLEYDVAFHTEIILTIDNQRIIDTYNSLNSFLKIARVFYFASYERSVNGQEEHERILKRIQEYDIDVAGRELTTHLEQSAEAMIAMLEEHGGAI